MTSFQMLKCRKLVETYQTKEELALISSLLGAIEQTVTDGSNGAFCLAYSLIDTACKTIFSQRGISDGDYDLPKRFKITIKNLNLVSSTYETERVLGLDTTMRGLEQAVKGLCELRNYEGIFSHGKSANFQHMDELQLQLAAETADTIVNYLFQAHFNYQPKEPELIYEDCQDFNEWIDEAHNIVEILGQTFLPSQILYMSDAEHTAYREALIEYRQLQGADEQLQ
jgi:hypothetical protein